ncbi:MAG: LysM peptidoglycan-binding domain-containing protein [Flavonifractor plautii]
MELVPPVTPSSYQWAHEAAIETVTVDQLGISTFRREKDGEHHPARLPSARPGVSVSVAGAGTNPWLYLEQLERWVDRGTVVRWLVSGTPVNAAVLAGGVTYREQDGTNDLYADITLRQYTRPETPVPPAEPSASGAGTAASRDSATGTATAKTCTVASGDTLWGICRRYYGDGSLAWRLAAANGIANANLIRPGQVLTIPPLAQLPAAAARPPSAKIAAATKVREVKEEESGTARLVPWVPENTVKSLADLELDKIASGGGLWQSTRW